jgi:uncharacterized membrane protein
LVNARTLKHLLVPHWVPLRVVTQQALREIESAIKASEQKHRGELRFAVEGSLPLAALRAGTRARAEELFSALRVWDTAENSGILIYVQLLDRRIEIIADRGIATKVAQAEWDAICRAMEENFRAARFREGSLRAIEAATALLGAHFPASGDNPNELPDSPVVM